MTEPADSAATHAQRPPSGPRPDPGTSDHGGIEQSNIGASAMDLSEAEIGALTASEIEALEPSEFAFPGPLRDELVAAILSGAKTSTSSLECEYLRDNDPLPRVGTVQRLVDSENRAVAVIVVTGVRVITLADVDLAHARDEGEGFETVTQWRLGHEGYWHGENYREYMADPGFTVTDTTRMIAERFRVVRRLA